MFGIVLEMQWIPGKQNPADRYSRCQGFKRWDEQPLAPLARPVALTQSEV
jgi:hypothetical protein